MEALRRRRILLLERIAGNGEEGGGQKPLFKVIGWVDRRCILLHRCGIGLDGLGSPLRHPALEAEIRLEYMGKTTETCVWRCILLHQSRAHPGFRRRRMEGHRRRRMEASEGGGWTPP
jgi:hypothetical protein